MHVRNFSGGIMKNIYILFVEHYNALLPQILM